MPDEDEQVAALRRTIKVKDGEDLVTEGVKASSGQSTWNEQSILECLLQGRRHPDPVWTLDDLDTFFKSYSRPVQIYKYELALLLLLVHHGTNSFSLFSSVPLCWWPLRLRGKNDSSHNTRACAQPGTG